MATTNCDYDGSALQWADVSGAVKDGQYWYESVCPKAGHVFRVMQATPSTTLPLLPARQRKDHQGRGWA